MFRNRSAPSSKGVLIVANKGESTLGIIDPETGKQVATVPEGGVLPRNFCKKQFAYEMFSDILESLW